MKNLRNRFSGFRQIMKLRTSLIIRLNENLDSLRSSFLVYYSDLERIKNILLNEVG